MENKITVLDTDFLWEYITGNQEAIGLLTSGDYHIIGLSAITVAELIKGCGNKSKLTKLNKSIKDFLPLYIDIEISTMAWN